VLAEARAELLAVPLVADLLDRCHFPAAGAPVTCAVSGGADSLALLALAVAAGFEVTAVHVDHQLRPGSGAEASAVAAAAGRFGAAFRSERVDAGGAGGNVEARARRARYAVLPVDVLTGHTADDQAETVLVNLLRGSGLDGLSGINPRWRPLLRLRRAETRALCVVLGLAAVHDPSNDDVSLRRNRIRHELMPLLDAIAERDVAALLARQSDILRDERVLLDELAAALDPADALAMAAAPIALARRALRRWLVDSDGYPPDAAAVERVLHVVHGQALACEISGGRRVSRHHQRLQITVPE
jgi:tRNA(Ile)-lysidine synthase